MSSPPTELSIDCHDNRDGSMVCLWNDCNNQEHAVYFKRDREYLYFDQINRCWVALLKNAEVLSSALIKTPDVILHRASRAAVLGAAPGDPTWEQDFSKLTCSQGDDNGNVKCTWIDAENRQHPLIYNKTTHYADYDEYGWFAVKKGLTYP